MRGKVEKMKIINQNKRYCDTEMNSVKSRTTHNQTVSNKARKDETRTMKITINPRGKTSHHS